MATVPVSRQATVAPAGPPNLFQRDSSSPDAFGAAQGQALQQAAQGLGQLGNSVTAIAQDKAEQDGANRVLEAQGAAQLRTNEALYQGDSALFGKTGKDAVGVRSQYAELSKGIYGEISATLKTPKEKAVFNRWAMGRDAGVQESLLKHEATQDKAYQSAALQASLAGAQDDAISGFTNPTIVKNAMDQARRAITAQNKGAPPEAIEVQFKQFKSGVNKGIIQRLLDSDVNAADKFYQENAADITGPDHIEIGRAFGPKRDRQELAEFGVKVGSMSQAGANLVAAVAAGESDGGKNTNHPARISGGVAVQAVGDHGVLISTAREISPTVDGGALVGKSDEEIKTALQNPDVSKAYSARYLDTQLKRYGGDVEAALIAYNAGPGNADKWLAAGRDYSKLPRPEETKPYVLKVLDRYADLAGGGEKDAAQVPIHAEIEIGNLPPPGQKMTRENWSLSFYKPQDILAPTAGGQAVDARSAVMADTLGRKFFEATGIKVNINDDHDFSGKGGTAGKRRGVADPGDNPHVSKSQHLVGKAFDFQVQGLNPDQKAQFLQIARSLGFSGVGFYGDAGHLHLDTGKARSWGTIPTWAQPAMKITVPSGAEGDQATLKGATAPMGSGLQATGPWTADKTVKTKRLAVDQMPVGAMTNAILFDPSAGSTGAFGSGNGTGAPASVLPPMMPTIAKTNDFDYDGALAQAEAQFGDRPELHRKAIAMIQAKQAQVDKADKAEVKQIVASAWSEIVQGKALEDLPAATLAAVYARAPEAIKGMEDYQAKRTKRGEPSTDWKAYYELTRKAAEDPRGFAEEDLFQYRPVLSDAEFKSLTEKQAAVSGDQRKAVNDQSALTLNDILKLSQQGMGLDPSKRPADAATMGMFQARMAGFAQDYAQKNKKAPGWQELKAHADYLMQPAPGTGGMFSSPKRLFELGMSQENIDARANGRDMSAVDSYTAASKLQDIPADALQHVAVTYRDMVGENPTPDLALRYYNDGMRAVVGGMVEPSEADRPEIVELVKQARPGVKVTDELVNFYYGQWAKQFVAGDHTVDKMNSVKPAERIQPAPVGQAGVDPAPGRDPYDLTPIIQPKRATGFNSNGVPNTP